MVQDSPSRKMDQFIVRLPDGMRDRIKAAAEANNRSMNAEVVATLEKEYPAPDPGQEFSDRVKRAVAEIMSIPDPDIQKKLLGRLGETLTNLGTKFMIDLEDDPLLETDEGKKVMDRFIRSQSALRGALPLLKEGATAPASSKPDQDS